MHKTSTLKISENKKNNLEPSKRCIDFLLNYSKAIEIKDSKLMDKIVLNGN
ncbi:MAG: hypothetical protein V4667_06130 [Bacteroidota bacterium]